MVLTINRNGLIKGNKLYRSPVIVEKWEGRTSPVAGGTIGQLFPAVQIVLLPNR